MHCDLHQPTSHPQLTLSELVLLRYERKSYIRLDFFFSAFKILATARGYKVRIVRMLSPRIFLFQRSEIKFNNLECPR